MPAWFGKVPYLQQVQDMIEKAGLTQDALLIIAAAAVAVLLAVIWALALQRKAGHTRKRLALTRKIIQTVKPDKGLENNLIDLLEFFDRFVEAPVYAFYVHEPRNNSYTLKAVRHKTKEIGSTMSASAEKKKENYHPPLSVQGDTGMIRSGKIVEGEVPLLVVPTGQGKGLVRIGPLSGKPSKRTLASLDELGELIGQMLDNLTAAEKLKAESDVVLASGKAMQQINQIALHPRMTVELMIQLSMQTMAAAGGCYAERTGDRYRIPVSIGLEEKLAGELTEDVRTLDMLHQLAANEEYVLLRRGDAVFAGLPAAFKSLGMDAIVVLQVNIGTPNFLIFWFDRFGDAGTEQAALSTMKMVQRDIRGIISHQMSLSRLAGTYTGILKGLAQLLDNMSPYTVGYSEMMSRYSIIIAKEIGLSEPEIRDVALAAYLSNIGMFGISVNLYQKEGKYSDQEFELMKLHAEVGASIVRTTLGNERVAEYILYHHERMDGNGYPAGLKGRQIPAGSKIIAVVQTFLAKINGRKYRDPLPFHQALQTLRAASGTQLDASIVDAFIAWFERKQRNPNFNARSLGSCWEMCCVPSSVCEHCPVYGRMDVNCWEVADNNCATHGKKCETCFVRTEHAHRTEWLKRAK
ncbi:HD-GYP domain-containing protein [Paenibacillus hamazuiensis]|uniref:HD-GYP domain-containing protein n=1 Tax=Paenibacillus hamazuiensis TaxID=2936508 RepID=UPI00200F0404|nr:HD domain-containing phosphohydrolase [Paenibacillus hamazuiensis]